jgi:hypothetical protein
MLFVKNFHIFLIQLYAYNRFLEFTYLGIIVTNLDPLCGLVVRVPDYSSRGPRLDSWCCQIL